MCVWDEEETKWKSSLEKTSVWHTTLNYTSRSLERDRERERDGGRKKRVGRNPTRNSRWQMGFFRESNWGVGCEAQANIATLLSSYVHFSPIYVTRQNQIDSHPLEMYTYPTHNRVYLTLAHHYHHPSSSPSCISTADISISIHICVVSLDHTHIQQDCTHRISKICARSVNPDILIIFLAHCFCYVLQAFAIFASHISFNTYSCIN